jgi:hypothetical protein
MATPSLLNHADHLLDRTRRVVFEAQRKRQVEEQLRIRRSLDERIE